MDSLDRSKKHRSKVQSLAHGPRNDGSWPGTVCNSVANQWDKRMSLTALSARTARQRLYDIVQQEAPFAEKAREALSLGVRYLGVDSGHLTSIDRKTGHWEALYSTDSRSGRVPEGLTRELGNTFCRETIEAEEPITLHDVPSQGWNADPAFDALGIHCYHGTTLHLNEDPYGTVCFVAEQTREEPFTDNETMFAELLTRLLEREFERHHHRQELTQRNNLVKVLNRVLRHNLRNDMTVIRARAKRMKDRLQQESTENVAIKKIDELIELTQKARDLEQIFDTDGERVETDIASLVEQVVANVEADFPDATITIESVEPVTAKVQPSFERALAELIENAAKHSRANPKVTVTIEKSNDDIRVRIQDNGPGLSEEEREVLERGVETPLVHGSGLGLWLAHWAVTSQDGSITPTVTENGTTMTISVPRSPTTDELRERAEIREARDQYESAFKAAFEAQIIIDDDARILESNPAAADLLGRDQAALRGQEIKTYLSNEVDLESSWASFKDDGSARDTVTIQRADGDTRQVEYSATADIVPGQHLIIARDITARAEREAELEQHETVIQTITDSAWVLDEAKEIVFANDTLLERLELPAAAVVGTHISEFQDVFVEDAAYHEWNALLDDVLTGAVSSGEMDITLDLPRGEVVSNLRVAPVTENGSPQAVAVVARNITDRVEREQKLAQAETVFENTHDAIFLIDVTDGGEFLVDRVNQVYEELTGLSNEAIQGKTPREITGPEIGSTIEARYQQCLDCGETIEYPEEIPVDGEMRYWKTKVTPVKEDGEVVKLVGAMRDITDHKAEEGRPAAQAEPQTGHSQNGQ
jgi:PAS domain S-box-containing protein